MLRSPASGEVAQAISTTQLCRTLQVLPRAGGLYDQSWITVELMIMVISAENEKERREREK